MNALSSRLESASDALNPLLVKDVRQALRTRAFSLSFALLLLIAVGTSLIAWSVHSASDESGPVVFGLYVGAFALVGFVIHPVSTFRAFARERESETWSLLQMTALTPRKILRGKLASAFVQAALYASAIAPFVMFSYFLQGVSLAVILTVMLFAFSWQAFLLTLAVTTATFGDARFVRAILNGAVGIATPILTIFGVAAFFQRTFLGSSWGTLEWPQVLLFAWMLLSFGVLAFECAAARLMSAGENHAIGPRIAAFVHLLGLALIVRAFHTDLGFVPEIAPTYVSMFVFLFGLFAMTEADGAPRGVRERLSIGLLLPGAKRGLVVTVALQLFVLVAFRGISSRDVDDELVATTALDLLALAVIVARLIPSVFATPGTRRMLVVALLLAARVIGPIVFGARVWTMGGIFNHALLTAPHESPVGSWMLTSILFVGAYLMLAGAEREAEAR